MKTYDDEYLNIVSNILDSVDFKNLKNCTQHGTNRYEHCLSVSYKAYKFAKKNKLDYESVAIAGLLHDFFDNTDANIYDRFKATFTHPVLAVENSKEKFNITEKEARIIRSHMFPINFTLPKDRESWVVTIYDKLIFFKEFIFSTCYKLRYITNLFIILFLNFIK